MERTLLILLPTATVGLVLGKGGQFFKYMSHISGTTMHLQSYEDMPSGSKERVMYISGTHESIRVAIQVLMLRIQKNTSNNVDETPTEDNPCGFKTTVNWIIPQKNAGLLIGKHGSRIRMINVHTGAWVKLSHPEETQPSLGERSVSIRGSPTAVDAAIDIIHDLVGGYRLVAPTTTFKTGILPDDDDCYRSILSMIQENVEFENEIRLNVRMRLVVLLTRSCILQDKQYCTSLPIEFPVKDVRIDNVFDSMYSTRNAHAISLSGSLESLLQTVPYISQPLMTFQRNFERWHENRRNMSPEDLQRIARAPAGCGAQDCNKSVLFSNRFGF